MGAVLVSAQRSNVTHLTPTSTPPPPAARLPVQVCNQLAAQLNTTIVRVREHDDFQDVARGAWNLFNTVYQPACIVFPRSDLHVQTTMKAIFDSGGVRYAVQAGGHSAMRGWNTVDGDGILISFAHMRGVSYDSAKDTITLQPGIRWGEALTELEPLGVAPMGGRLPDVGTGLLLGGGLSYLSARHGFSVDALVEADVVLVNGEMVTATAQNQYSDLFKALKGGANRFGIFDNSSTEGLLRAVADYVDKVDDPGSSLLAVFGYTFSNTTAYPVNIITFFYNGTEDPTEVYSDFFALNATQSLVGDFSYMEATQILGNGDERGFGQLFGASAFGNAEYEGVTPDANFERSTDAGIAAAILAFTPVLKSQILASRAKGGTAMDPPVANYHLIQFHVQTLPGFKTDVSKIQDARGRLLRSIPASPGLPLYINESDESQQIFATYGGYNFLKQTYRKYDPTRFNMRFTTGPLGL
ncbi:hypothetical protein BKA70DRAFT_1196861 [Coprinopsis sp. MPI-PUGE-AT-0042]|nr:hypothetical protein BKA70DRAFT_1196861 [Coprinopsis sp. MPI-PUGE-AT-0042]